VPHDNRVPRGSGHQAIQRDEWKGPEQQDGDGMTEESRYADVLRCRPPLPDHHPHIDVQSSCRSLLPDHLPQTGSKCVTSD